MLKRLWKRALTTSSLRDARGAELKRVSAQGTRRKRRRGEGEVQSPTGANGDKKQEFACCGEQQGRRGGKTCRHNVSSTTRQLSPASFIIKRPYPRPGIYLASPMCASRSDDLDCMERRDLDETTSIGPRRQAMPKQCRESECAVIKLFQNMSPMGVPDRSDSKMARIRQKNRLQLPFDSINNNECAQRYPATCCAAFPREREVEGQPSESTTQEAYNPHLNRVTYRPVSDFGSLANLIKSAAGTGLFAMPNAFACVGLFIGIVGTAFMGLLITGSLQLLVRIHHMMCVRLRKPKLVYDEVVVATLTTDVRKPWLSPRAATLSVDVIMLACYIGIGSVYVVFIAGTIQECIDTEKVISQSYYALMIFPLLFVMNMVKNLADIAPISIVGNILLIAAGLIGIVYALKDGIGDEWVTIGPNVDLYPKFIGLVFFSMCSPGVILAIEHSMKKPWNYIQMCGVLNWGMAFLVIIHIFVGAIGYLKWGPIALGNFIRNHEVVDGPTLAALIMQALAIYFTYGLQCYMPIRILNDGYAIPAIEEGILAAAIPKLDLFTGLVGSVCISTLATLIPGIEAERRRCYLNLVSVRSPQPDENTIGAPRSVFHFCLRVQL
ncbi:Proton-coupled amino acid transporter 4 [Trachymyrmex septentrionalis]|uniref:Proton-coupled amino acid transporter 4 n=1 Tax=Trachymyrmex septentrionalis TaxID=34720 RepID=A0A195FIR8_9HYME|nr:Proton-coupled amino acid transporter 4 [Trachymyrmex septentrionalis]